jgi:SP family sugar:H+ symporter-like MFS transporter
VEEARRVVAELNGVPLDDPLVIETVEELQFAITEENEGGKATWAECFSSRNSLWKRTGNGMMLQFIQQLNGQNFYCASLSGPPLGLSLTWKADYYGDTFFKSAGTEYVSYKSRYPSLIG